MRSVALKISLVIFSLVDSVFFSFCVSEVIVESLPETFPYHCIGENSSNAHVAELGRRAALQKDSQMPYWKKPLCYVNETKEEWIVSFFRKDNIPDDVYEVSGGELIEIRISAKELRIKSISSNIRYER